MSKVQGESSGHCQENESGSDRGPKQLHRGGIRFRYCSSKHVLTAGGPVSLGISTGSGFYCWLSFYDSYEPTWDYNPGV